MQVHDTLGRDVSLDSISCVSLYSRTALLIHLTGINLAFLYTDAGPSSYATSLRQGRAGIVHAIIIQGYCKIVGINL